MMDCFKRLKKQGLKCTAKKGFERILLNLKMFKKEGSFYFTKHFYKILPSFLPKYNNPTRNEIDEIEKELLTRNVFLNNYPVLPDDFNDFVKKFEFGDDFYDGQDNPVWTEKVLEHFIAWEMAVKYLESDEIYIDVAASSSPWVKMLNEKGFKAIGIDLNESWKFKDDPNYLVMDATKTTFKDGSVSGVSLQCAFEMFTGNDDKNLMKELGRILKPGGKAVIVPLYMHTHHCGYTTKEFRFSRKYHDLGAKLYLRKDFSGIPFSRKYDVEVLKERVLDVAQKNGLEYKIYVLRNGKEIHEGVYCHFILELVKK
jgi:ubiquinone/menaquinone biosynthesis C-methylase UbiE